AANTLGRAESSTVSIKRHHPWSVQLPRRPHWLFPSSSGKTWISVGWKKSNKVLAFCSAQNHSLTNVILAPRQGRAVKPDASYRMIEAMSPEPRLELFARRKLPGWFVWGDQIDSDVSIDWHPERAVMSGP